MPHRLPCPVRAQAQRQPEAAALVMPDRVVNYRDFDAVVTATAAAFRARGWQDGARLSFFLPNSEAFLVLLLAAWRTGAVAAPLNTRLPRTALPAHLARLGSRHLITAEAVQANGVEVLAPGAVLAPGNAAPDGSVAIPADQPATLLFTSGSSGPPKIALHSYGNHHFNALGSNENIALHPGDRWLLSLPLYHVGGLAILFRCFLAGAAVVLPPAEKRPLAETLATRRVTHVSLVATQLLRLLRTPAATEASAQLKAVLLGGSAMPAALLDAAQARHLPLHTTYGLTEMASQVTTTPPGATAAHLRTSGRCLPHRELALHDGEICVRGATLFLGYWTDHGLDPHRDADGWFPTGDLGRLDGDGYLHVAGRRDALFISGGENIQPEEIEHALTQLPGVVQAAVVPVPDAEFGARPVAFVRTDGIGISPEKLTDQLAEMLPRFKMPQAFYPWPEEAEGMKIDRAWLRREAETRH